MFRKSLFIKPNQNIITKLASASLAITALSLNAEAAFVLGYTDSQNTQSLANVQAYYRNMSAIAISSAYQLTTSGTVNPAGANSTSSATITFAKSVGLPIYGTVSDWGADGWDPAVSQSIDNNSSIRNAAVTNTVNFAVTNGFAGINLDFEAVAGSDVASYPVFVNQLASALHAKGLKLILSAPTKWAGVENQDNQVGYDFAALGANIDYFQVMTYDECGLTYCSTGYNGGNIPGPVAGNDWSKDVIAYTKTKMPASKILAGIPAYGKNYSVPLTDENGGVIELNKIASYLSGKSNVVYGRDAASGSAWAKWGTVTNYQEGSANLKPNPVIWYDDAISLTAKAGLVKSQGIAGTSVWAIGQENDAFWVAVNAGLNSGASSSSVKSSSSASTSSTPANTNIAPSGAGATWSKNTTALANTNKLSNGGVVDNQLNDINVNPAGENGQVRYEAAGVTWSTTKTITSVKFVNGTFNNGDGIFGSGLSLQYTTNGTTWVESGWSVSPSYPYTSAASGVTYSFSGAQLTGVTGVRVSGKTSATAWFWSVKEVQAIGR